MAGCKVVKRETSTCQPAESDCKQSRMSGGRSGGVADSRRRRKKLEEAWRTVDAW